MTYALRDLTGGAPQTVDLRTETIQDQILNGFLWQQLKLWVRQGLMGCSQSDDDPKEPREFGGDFRKRRVYGLLDVQEPAPGRRFLKLRSYFGPAQWRGKWSNDSPEWLDDPEMRAALRHDPARAGDTFWMEFDDWIRYMTMLHICQMYPASWEVSRSTHPDPDPYVLEGVWSKERRLCGGSLRKGNSTWWANPQFRMRLSARTQVILFTQSCTLGLEPKTLSWR